MIIERVDEILSNVLAQEKMPTLLRLGYIPENLWNGKIRNILVEVTDSSDYVRVNAKFEWEIDGMNYQFKNSLPLSSLSKAATKQSLLYELQNNTYIIFHEKRIISEFDFLKMVDCENQSYSDDLFTVLENLVSRMFSEVFLEFRG